MGVIEVTPRPTLVWDLPEGCHTTGRAYSLLPLLLLLLLPLLLLLLHPRAIHQVSSIPLAFVDFFKHFPSLKQQQPAANELARNLFAPAFIICRRAPRGN